MDVNHKNMTDEQICRFVWEGLTDNDRRLALTEIEMRLKDSIKKPKILGTPIELSVGIPLENTMNPEFGLELSDETKEAIQNIERHVRRF